ncbi:hypothetical protein VE00_05796 [Pseudogymnoascus sp. WSF 3629]|nr:hypothetical protein VE00_05796 [Pseudogymnoascus sp. WSF 3629]
MDPLSITSSIIAIVQSANAVRDHLKHRASKSSDKKANASYELQEIEYMVHIDILEDISHNILSLADTSSDFDKGRIQLCLKLCHLSLGLVGSIKNAKTKPADLEKQLQDFARSVKLLRDIVTDSTTHVMLREQRKIILDQAHMLEFYMKHTETQLKGLTVLVQQSDSYGGNEIRIIEENARKKGATNEQVATIRRADDALARERKRQQKASSRISLSATPGTSTGSLTPYCTLGNVTPYGQILSPYPRATQQQRSPSSLS